MRRRISRSPPGGWCGGKLLNAGQTCVAPDYVLVHHSREQALVEALIGEIRARYTSAPLMNEEWPHIINRKHFDRLVRLLGSGGHHPRRTD